ncbi:MAG TPA: hypothetical protein VHZ54_11810 [Solirubrobacterales bacterium]|jgi:hypothetical protein|nr:hypothetical protein [Solirubrobacterales bacterium]
MSYRNEPGKREAQVRFGPGARLLLSLNAGTRVAYGVGILLSPATMERLAMAPDTSDRPQARLFVRAFGGHMIGVGALGLFALRHRRLERPAAAAALAIDLADIASALVEATKRGRLESDLSGGIVFSASGAISAALALR